MKETKILSLKYGRVSNLGNFETERVEVEMSCEGEDPQVVLTLAKAWVNTALGIDDTLTPEQIKRLERSIERSKRRNAVGGY